MEVTIFKSKKETSTGFIRDVFYALERIRCGKSKALVELLQSTIDEDYRQDLKGQLVGVCFSGAFRNRSVAGLMKHSGLIVLDFDKFENKEELKKYRIKLEGNDYIFACWLSPSGNGIKALIKVSDVSAENHKSYFEAIVEYFDCENLDRSGSDVSRLCFESYDPNIYINKNSKLWEERAVPDAVDIGVDVPVLPIRSENRIITNLLTWFNRKYPTGKGNRNTNLFKLACGFNSFGVAKSECENALRTFEAIDFKYSEIQLLINSAYKKVEQFGTKFFEDTITKEKIEKQIRAAKPKKEIETSFPDLKKEDLEAAISGIKETVDIKEYWYYEGDDNKIKLSPHKFKFWLEQQGFRKYYPEKGNTFTFIRIEQNLLELTSEKRIKDYVLKDLLSRSDIGFKPYDFMAASTKYFSEDFLSMIDTAEVEVMEDTASENFLYYKNCIISVSKEGFKIIDYCDVNGYIWRRQIIDRNYTKSDHHQSVFRSFIWFACGQNTGKYNSFKSVIGYLLHSYKTSANNRAIIFNDETISENPNGGSGKGLFWNSLSNMKRVAMIDGKTFTFEKSFPYQTVSTDTQIIVFDDVNKNFNFEKLFPLITEGITIEYKRQDAIKIPVKKSPKVLITTNYTIGGVGGSFDRRKFEIEMSSFFNSNHTPLDYFGHMFFDEWDAEEWARFDSYMINCSIYYLQNGLVSHDFKNLAVRKFIKETAFEFYDWATEETLPCGVRIKRGDKLNTFFEDYPDFKKWLTQKKFSMWIDAYAKFKGLEIQSTKYNGVREIIINKVGEETNLEEEKIPF